MEELTMKESNRNQNNPENKMKRFKNINQSALNYVQPAIENAAESSRDATQNLVNNTINNQER
jgi:DNA-binding ferritin-like protein